VTVREEAQAGGRVPEDRHADAFETRHQWVSPEPGDTPRRRFRTTAMFDGDPDAGTRAKQIVRDASTGWAASGT